MTLTTHVWTYWEGPKPVYIDTCLASLSRTCSSLGTEFHLLTPDTLPTFLSPQDLHPNYQKLPQIALKADCIRAVLLAKYGGFWWDADTIGFQSPCSLLKQYPKAEALYSIWSNLPLRVLNGYIYLRPNSKAGQKWAGQVNYHLKQNPQGTKWCDLGENILTKVLPGRPGCKLVDRRIFLPIDVDSSVHRFFQPGDFRRHLLPNTVCYGLNHSWFLHHQRSAINLPQAAWKNSPLLIHQLLHYAQEHIS